MWNPRTLRHWLAIGEDGATAVEYALMIALIALVIFAGVAALGLALPEAFGAASTPLS